MEGFKFTAPQEMPHDETADEAIQKKKELEASQESDKRIQSACAELGISLGEIAKVARRREGDGFNELFPHGAQRIITGTAEWLHALSRSPDGISEKDAAALSESVSGLIRSFDMGEIARTTELRDDRDSLRRLSSVIAYAGEQTKAFEALMSAEDSVKFEGMYPLLDGLRTNLENFGSMVNRRRVALDRYLDR